MEYDAGWSGVSTGRGAPCRARVASSALGAPRIAALFDQLSDAAALLGADCAVAGVAAKAAPAAVAASHANAGELDLGAMGPRVAAQSEFKAKVYG